MTFREELAAAVMAGAKRVTRRAASQNPRSPWYVGGCSLVVGRDYAVQPGRGKPAIGRARIVSVRLDALGRLSEREAELEGFPSAQAFEDTFAALNGGRYDPTVPVWRIELEAVRP
jgi:hypothetical protein